MYFGMNHAPGAGSITRPFYLQPSALLLSHTYALWIRWYFVCIQVVLWYRESRNYPLWQVTYHRSHSKSHPFHDRSIMTDVSIIQVTMYWYDRTIVEVVVIPSTVSMPEYPALEWSCNSCNNTYQFQHETVCCIPNIQNKKFQWESVPVCSCMNSQ